MRIFIALKLPQEFVSAIHNGLQALQNSYPDFRWTKEENLHITLAFFKELNDQGVTLLNEAVSLAVQNAAPVSISAGKLFTLPLGRSANVLALSIEQGKDPIAALAADIEQALTDIGKQQQYSFRNPETRTFIPHITLARKGRVPLKFSLEERNTPVQAQGIIHTLVIFKSGLYHNGPVYTPLSVYPL